MIRSLLLAAAFGLCSAAAPAPTFDPLAFFTGQTRGAGSLKVMLKPMVPIHVESEGHPDGNGGIVLEQTIREGAKPPRKKRWLLRPTSLTTLTGTATNTPGRVRGRLSDNRLWLDYSIKGGLRVEQVLTLQPSGDVISRMTIKRLGIRVAHVEELITKSE